MLAVAAHQSDGRGALAAQAQVHSLAGSPLGADNSLMGRQLMGAHDGHIPPTRPTGDKHLTQQPQLPLASSLTAGLQQSLSNFSSHTTSLSGAEQLLDTVASTFNQMHRHHLEVAGPNNQSALALTSLIATATGQATTLPQQQQQQQPPTLASFTSWEWLLITVLISIILISIIGNCLVCVAIFTDRRLRKLGNAFIVSLAIADLFVSCLVMTFALCNDLMNYWMFGEWFCDIWISFDIMCSTASILNLCAISLDRFIHIKDCLLYNQLMTKRVAISAVIIIWIISALVSFVPINLGWHKPNHFKQALNGTPGDANHRHHNLDLLAASLADELAPGVEANGDEPRRALDDDRTSPEGDLEAEDKRLALIGHDASRDQATPDRTSSRRHKRQAGGEANGRRRCGHPEGAAEGSSEIRGVRSQIANKLHTSEIFPSISAGATGDGLERSANLGAAAAAEAQVLNRGGERRAGHHQGNNLSRGPTARSNDDDGGGGGGHDYDVRKQSRPDPLGLHKNELSDQVAAPLAEFNLVLPRQRGLDAAGPLSAKRTAPPAKQIKHSRASSADPSSGRVAAAAPSNAAHRPPPGGPVLDSHWQLAGVEPPRDSHGREQTDQPNASSNVDNQNARRQDKILTKTSAVAANRKRRQARQSGASDGLDTMETKSTSTTTNPKAEDWHQGRAARLASQTSPPAEPATPNELPQCMLTLTPTYAVISSTISFYIPCIIMLGLYSKLFACARRHVRNIKAISKAPQPIGFVAPAENAPAPAAVAASVGSTIGRAARSGPMSDAAGFVPGADSNRGEIINCRRPLASKRLDQSGQLASPILLSSSQAVASVNNTSPHSYSNSSSGPTTTPTVNNNEQNTSTTTTEPTTGGSLSSHCRAKLARLVRRPEPKSAPDNNSNNNNNDNSNNKSRTWIKFGRQPRGALKSGPLTAKSDGVVESILSSTSSKLLPQPQPERDGMQNANSQKIAPNGGGLIMKLNQQQNARSQPAASDRQVDCNDPHAGLPNDNNDHSETIAHGNETEPFLNSGRNAVPEELHCQPEADQAHLSSRLATVSREDLASRGGGGGGRGGQSSRLDDGANPSRTTTNASLDGAQILNATSAAFTSTAAGPLKSSFSSSNSHQAATNLRRQQQQQQQRQHQGGSWRKHQQSQQNKQQTNQLATHKAAITLGIIMGTFLFCWVPFFCLNIIKAFHGDSIPSSLFRAFTWLGYANSALNPIIYGIHNSEFRNAFNRIFFKHLTLKNGRQYLNRRFSYDLRPHVPSNQQNYEQTRWPNNINNRPNCASLEANQQQQRLLLPASQPATAAIESGPMSQQRPDSNVAHRHHH